MSLKHLALFFAFLMWIWISELFANFHKIWNFTFFTKYSRKTSNGNWKTSHMHRLVTNIGSTKAIKLTHETLEIFAPLQKQRWKLLVTTSSFHVECWKANIWPLETSWHFGIDGCVRRHPHNCLTTLELCAWGAISDRIATTSLFFFSHFQDSFLVSSVLRQCYVRIEWPATSLASIQTHYPHVVN